MKKQILSLLSIGILTATLLVGCGTKGPKDGTYKAEYDTYDVHGWKSFVEITVADSTITDVNFDYINEEGKLKSEDEGYKQTMEKSSGTYPSKFSSDLEEALIEKQNPNEIDVVTGATTSTDHFKSLVTYAMQYAEKGKSETAIVEAPR